MNLAVLGATAAIALGGHGSRPKKRIHQPQEFSSAIMRLFHRVDKNKNGRLEREELKSFFDAACERKAARQDEEIVSSGGS